MKGLWSPEGMLGHRFGLISFGLDLCYAKLLTYLKRLHALSWRVGDLISTSRYGLLETKKNMLHECVRRCGCKSVVCYKCWQHRNGKREEPVRDFNHGWEGKLHSFMEQGLGPCTCLWTMNESFTCSELQTGHTVHAPHATSEPSVHTGFISKALPLWMVHSSCLCSSPGCIMGPSWAMWSQKQQHPEGHQDQASHAHPD